MGWVEIMPGYETLFRRLGWDSAASFLAWTGVFVNRHRHRSVEFVSEPEASATIGGEFFANASGSDGFYIKKEVAVSWRDRFGNAWDGFGWCATAVREAAMLQALRREGIGCPDVVALGEDRRRAFVVTREEPDLMELRRFLQTAGDADRIQVAVALGRELARMHDAGFDHPDLFAKHILVGHNPQGIRISILDWQRGRHRRSVSLRIRCRDLAILDATLHEELASDRLRLRFLRAYLKNHRDMPFGRIAREIRHQAERRQTSRAVREHRCLPITAADQQLVPKENGRLLVVRSYFEKCGGCLSTLSIEERVTVANASGSEIPSIAHTLFRLQRFGVPAPKLLAVRLDASSATVFARMPAVISLNEALVKASRSMRGQWLRQAGQMIRRVHEAGYYLPAEETWSHCLGVVNATGEVILAQVAALLRGRASWQDLAAAEFSRETLPLSRVEQLRFLSGYLQRRKRVRESERRAAA